jgi:DNA-directed RNA polymerase subunit RPC12/RpoP
MSVVETSGYVRCPKCGKQAHSSDNLHWHCVDVNCVRQPEKKPYIGDAGEDGTVWSDEGIPCPYCQHVRTEDIQDVEGAYEHGDHVTRCGNCLGVFEMHVEASFSYTSRKRQKL